MLKLFKLLLLFLTLNLFVRFSSIVYAVDFKTDYQVEYNLSQSQDNLNSQVDFRIRITNLRSDVYVNKFAISFPNTFSINDLKASDDNGFITPITTVDDQKTRVELEFSSPAIGKDSTNTFFLNFSQANLFKVNGRVWEVVLPVIENSQDESYQVIVNLPEATTRKISIAKPNPDSISVNKIIWNNPKTKTIYAVFGDSQVYQTDLTYHIKNDQIYPIFTEIAFPPETVNQKMFLQSINPPPESVRQDEDGNYLGKYFLKPLETKTITYKSLIEIYAKTRDEAMPVLRSAINQQKNYLLTAKKYWQINQIDSIKNIDNVKDIYDFVTGNLKYNYSKINSQNKRLGADFILSHPDQAVCLEFTDLFVAMAREKGIYSREVEGYGFSLDPRLQPLSLSSDILHSWPEYFDAKTENWIAVDPTWENTSGINYFSSFDLNHIVFAIHGKNPDYPLPAGMYKIENSRDISIKPVVDKPLERKEVVLENIDFPTTISDEKNYQGKFIVKNNGNSYLWQVPVEVKGKNLTVSKGRFVIPVLAPFEKRSITFSYSSQNKNKRVQGVLLVDVLQKQLLESKISVIPFIYSLIVKIFAVILGILSLFLIYRLFRKLKHHDY
jgi:transglutaminase-like putative cysteine protease